MQTKYRRCKPSTDQVQTKYKPSTDQVQTKYRPSTDQVQTKYRLNLEAAVGRVCSVCARCVLGVCSVLALWLTIGLVLGLVHVVVVTGHFWCSYAWVSLTYAAPMYPRVVSRLPVPDVTSLRSCAALVCSFCALVSVLSCLCVPVLSFLCARRRPVEAL